MYDIVVLQLTLLVLPAVGGHSNKVALFATDQLDTMDCELAIQSHIEQGFQLAGIKYFDQLCFDFHRVSSFQG
jgi:hypothetical protein